MRVFRCRKNGDEELLGGGSTEEAVKRAIQLAIEEGTSFEIRIRHHLFEIDPRALLKDIVLEICSRSQNDIIYNWGEVIL